jgi:hypothetical protein
MVWSYSFADFHCTIKSLYDIANGEKEHTVLSTNLFVAITLLLACLNHFITPQSELQTSLLLSKQDPKLSPAR